MLSFRRHPDMAQATRVGDPTLVDPKPTSAPEIVRQSMEALTGAGANKVSVEQVGGAPAANQPPPRSDSTNPNSTANPNSTGNPNSAPAKNDPSAIPELTPMNSDPSGSSATPAAGNADGTAAGPADPASPASPPPQVNDAPAPDSSQAQSGQTTSSDTSQSDNQSSSKTKKKKGLKKLNPF